jgi:hypothetical protein
MYVVSVPSPYCRSFRTGEVLAQGLSLRPALLAASMATPSMNPRLAANTGASEHGAYVVAAHTRSRSRSVTPEHGYRSPWLQFDPSSLLPILRQLDVASERPFSHHQFHEAVCGASEHDRILVGSCSRSTSHWLSTMARSVTAMIRYREEASPEWEEILPKIIACARRVASKTPPRQHSQVIRSLYDFACNRCDDAAMRILSERALTHPGHHGRSYPCSSAT